jgi:CheY-like chemotaxis protein
MNMLILVVDDEPDVEVLFRQQFRRDLRNDRFTMEFAQSAPMALQRITDIGDRSLILILSDINMPGTESLLTGRVCRPATAMSLFGPFRQLP